MVIHSQRSINLSSTNKVISSCHNTTKETVAPFVQEADLVNKFKDITRNNITITGHMCELDSGNGIADIVLFKQRKDWSNYSDISLLNPKWTYLLVVLPYRKVFNLDYFTTISCTTNQTALKVLNQYTLIGYCRKTPNGWIKLRQPRPPISKIFAIEAKLRDWKKAMQQATRYLDFAHQSWVLLDNYYCKPALKHRDEFIKRNIGLITINTSSELNVLIKAKPQPPRTNYRFWGANTSIVKSLVNLDTLSYTN